jgi:hypothetical protein
MPYLELFDETLDINATHNYELSLQLSPDGVAFSILDTIRSKYILLRSFDPDGNRYFTDDNIRDIIARDDFLTKEYKKVNIVMPSQKFTLVPEPLFDPGKNDEYFCLNLIKEENETIITNKVHEPAAYLIFSVARPLFEIAGHFYPSVYPSHHIKPLLNQVTQYSKSHSGTYFHVHIEKEYFNVLVLEQNVLKFSNTYRFRNISDILYYVLNIFRTFGLGQDVTLHFSGLTEKYDDLYSSFAIYVRNMKFTGPSGNFSFSYVFNNVELHRYINLFSITNCG